MSVLTDPPRAQTESDAQPRPGPWSRTGLGASLAAAALTWLAAHLLVFGHVDPVYWLPALTAALLGMAAVTGLMARHYPHRVFGWGNAVTLLRASLTIAFLTPLIGGVPAGWTVAAVAAIALALDGVDGQLARRHGRASAFGARFDVEVDSILALLLALNAVAAGHGGPVVLFLGLARYLFILLGFACPWLTGPLPPRFRRKAVCVLQMTALIALQLPGLPGGVEAAVAFGATAALAWSFAVDIVWLWRHRA